uniref:F-box domain-containing protein n=1 Tax=Arundo donax TaxID=35708 RepID=A0A0A9A2C6_ARUDO
MASLRPCFPPANRARRAPAASNAGVLPIDVLFDVLLRLPPRELCRLRAVCRSWRSLTSDPLFIGEHAARHPGPLLLANFRGDQAHIDVVDLSGNVIKRIRGADGHQLLCTRLDMACVATAMSSCRVLNPATGAAYILPGIPIGERMNREDRTWPYSSFAFGHIAATGQYKVLRMFEWREFRGGFVEQQLFDVFTISGDAHHVQWREMECFGPFVETSSAVVVDGVVYFLMDFIYQSMLIAGVNPGIRPDCIFSIDLEREEWRGQLQGPVSVNLEMDNLDDFDEYCAIWSQLTLADLKGSLVLVNYCSLQSTMDLWLLTDFENGLWLKEYGIQTESIVPRDERRIKALLVLDGGRLVIHLAWTGLLLIYDPRMNSLAEVGMRPLDAVGMYTGSLLSLQGGDMV